MMALEKASIVISIEHEGPCWHVVQVQGDRLIQSQPLPQHRKKAALEAAQTVAKLNGFEFSPQLDKKYLETPKTEPASKPVEKTPPFVRSWQGYYHTPKLKELGWTEKLIKDFLGEPDALAKNPVYSSKAPVKLFSIERVDQVVTANGLESKLSQNLEQRRKRAEKGKEIKVLPDPVETYGPSVFKPGDTVICIAPGHTHEGRRGIVFEALHACWVKVLFDNQVVQVLLSDSKLEDYRYRQLDVFNGGNQ